MAATVQAGETVRCDCDDCGAEFEVTYEPKAKGRDAVAIAPKQVTHCPLCGSESITSDGD
jgi:Zn finger protein HypA/HybF involved in hydrogenase expression